jgi:hypothetical protein
MQTLLFNRTRWPSNSGSAGVEGRIVGGANLATNCLGIALIPAAGNEACQLATIQNRHLDPA